MVDVKRWQKRHWHNELEHLQVETASHILFTREEHVAQERFAEVREDIEWFNPWAEWIKRQPFALVLVKLIESSKPHKGARRRKPAPASVTTATLMGTTKIPLMGTTGTTSPTQLLVSKSICPTLFHHHVCSSG